MSFETREDNFDQLRLATTKDKINYFMLKVKQMLQTWETKRLVFLSQTFCCQPEARISCCSKIRRLLIDCNRGGRLNFFRLKWTVLCCPQQNCHFKVSFGQNLELQTWSNFGGRENWAISKEQKTFPERLRKKICPKNHRRPKSAHPYYNVQS